ncbi:MAG: cytochrome c oxidase subunit 3 family protein [Rhodothermaceae bacterium]|nr:cytochrome c oxidase subunit 3 family protein [Rhodothermaceae bacterium]MXX58853.1 cytochrome c oxidase subunit 3 family protein [Rhodothermaceae bacterium]MYD18348.1 cytochrome c oxidase subunit 3 family protein [Rhodothermaceae bacterium]MYD55738.1 cytochrome c oxidase subunit 3 family protein [Rhodothermaceae bacterium]MYI42593.1 cytochrome c oxidase subunit 3 family protein [Rhodothermaceae bacterium]
MSSTGTTLKHYFVNHDQQFDAAKLGMWLFLVTEILLFSGMFVAYAVYRSWHPEVFVQASELLDWRLGALNTVVLLASSFTVALSIHFIQKGENDKVVVLLLMTLLCAAIFMVVKYFEYSGKFSHGVFPGAGFEPHGIIDGKDYSTYDIPFAPQFFSIYFVMTGIHGVHVLVGMGVFVWLVTRVARGHFSPQWYTPVELTGLYWHLVDIIWIFLFPLLYLI